MNYRVNAKFNIHVGFSVSHHHIKTAVEQTNQIFAGLPATLFRSIDYKTTSAMIGAVFCDVLAGLTDGIVNPIEKGHPDIIPAAGAVATEAELRKYPLGLEVKCTVGNIKTGANLRAGTTRVSDLTGITWQAHHREVEALLGLIWDFYMTSCIAINWQVLLFALPYHQIDNRYAPDWFYLLRLLNQVEV